MDWIYRPSSELAGDSFGYHWIDSEHFAVYLLDVCGHGVGACLLSVSAINVIRSGALPGVDFQDPGAVLTALNDAFPMERQNNLYFTLWYGVYHAPSRMLTFASGGHPPALLVEAGPTGTLLSRRLTSNGMIIGVMEDMPQLGDGIRGIVWLGLQAVGFLSSWAWIFSIRRAKSIGFVSYSSHPASRHFSRSPGMA